MDAQTLAEPRRPRLNPYTKALRRERIFANLRLGRTYADIAGEEGVSERRIRQIVSDALERREFLAPKDHALIQLMRIESAHGLAADKIAAGDLSAIGPYLKVLDRLDRYRNGAAPRDSADDGDAHERLLDRMSQIHAGIVAREAPAAAKRAEPAAPGLAPANPADSGLSP